MRSYLIFCFSFLILNACGQQKSGTTKQRRITVSKIESLPQINETKNTIASRFTPPSGFLRPKSDTGTFASFLRKLPLKPHGSLVRYYDQQTKPNRNIYDAVLDLPIGKRDLHQCADAIMRLRADYLFQNKKYDSIHFNFTNGFKADYNNWRKGKRIVVNGNQVLWKQKAQPSDSSKDFWKYLEMIFSYAGTASLSKEMKSIHLSEMQIGDVFIKGGFPGHAVIIVDIAVKEITNEKVFLLAQSYMPAQELQILKNPNNANLSPWYSTNITKELVTPEWKFYKNQLKRF